MRRPRTMAAPKGAATALKGVIPARRYGKRGLCYHLRVNRTTVQCRWGSYPNWGLRPCRRVRPRPIGGRKGGMHKRSGLFGINPDPLVCDGLTCEIAGFCRRLTTNLPACRSVPSGRFGCSARLAAGVSAMPGRCPGSGWLGGGAGVEFRCAGVVFCPCERTGGRAGTHCPRPPWSV